MKVKVRNNNVDKALRVFKKKCSDVVFEYREREFFEKPATKRHKAKKAAIKREQRRVSKERERYGKRK
jgi:small subunit ribosomal protein S21